VSTRRRRSLLIGVVIGVAVGALAAVVLAVTGGGGAAHPDAVLVEPGSATSAQMPVAKDVSGKVLPSDRFDLLQGGATSFAAYRGTPLVVNVWASWCPPCKTEMPDFQRVHQALGGAVRFVGLDRADGADAAKAFVAKAGVTYDIVTDPDDRFARAMDIAIMPTTLLVSADGVVVATLSGIQSADELTARIHEAFPG
jgi:cytochrome c biogenesis protein CcmG, thiol:disulfide interchange protein DsbE